MSQKLLSTGLDLKPSFRVAFNSQLYEVMEEAPYDANAFAYFKKRDTDLVSGLLIVASCEGQFVASCKGRDVERVGRRLFQKMRHQLQCWRDHRQESVGYSAGHSLGMAH